MKEKGTETLSQALTGRVRIKFRSLNPSSTSKPNALFPSMSLPSSQNTEEPGGSCYTETSSSSEVPLRLLVKVTQLCPTLCHPLDYTVLGILQAKILEWVAIPFSREPAQSRDRTQVSCIAGRFLTS